MKPYRLSRFVSYFGGTGLAVALVFSLTWWIDNRFMFLSLKGNIILQKITFMLWPSSLWLLGPTQGIVAAEVFLVAAAVNILIYALFGVLIWLGLYKSRPFMALPLALVAAGWWWLLDLK